ncbi:hypothetical protein [Pelagicoccus sp. SDUM812003]|uniref:hypothetical protein n=1 Tax=Pelagicoccus sp. SDUM812003 TaxID=3041267 RepID=UPI00280E36DB|nr:hypothetical protein [Pelagicoccus sp. SDUM812003]MDQ8205776.1 hypothetical protein [Pelagicoccus sp. SDUM812003]
MKSNVFILMAAVLASLAVAKDDAKFYRIITDFNLDGFRDVAFSEPDLCGNAGCWWTIHFGKENGSFENEFTSLFFHPLAFNISDKGDTSTITVYHRGGGGEGSLITYEIERFEFIEISTQTIHPDDNGNEGDQALYESLFGELRANRLDESLSKDQYFKQIEEIKANQSAHTTPVSAPR